MRKRVSIDHSIPRAAVPKELHPDWLASAAVTARAERDGETTERSLSITL
ncbi:hypothetical protein [Allomesorhizobium camelthorni]|uniref:Uncharacterized protein n=1 Tax=Allomesorhizobium camelthorni TaxID=475069 RepID=A0A6G4W8G7_9HYPH|nr:hypothetical protein [Mesorhizobium camelthorni]NGO51061.1 hypothetical protein [Mesorhizobium camelthorni]